MGGRGRRRRRWRWWGGALVVVIALLTLGAWGGWVMLRSETRVWRDAGGEVAELADAASVAADLEAAVQRAVTAHLEPGEERVLVVPMDAANAWLETRLPLWLEAQGQALPEQVAALRLASRPGVVTGMVMLEHEGAEQLLSAEATAEVGADGRMVCRLLGVRLGWVPIPLGLIVDRLEDASGSQRAGYTAGAYLRAGAEGYAFDPAGPLPNDERVLRVTGIEIEAGRVLVTLAHE